MRYLINQGSSLNAGDEVKVKAYQTHADLFAISVTVGDKTIRLRDENGFPLWRGGGRLRLASTALRMGLSLRRPIGKKLLDEPALFVCSANVLLAGRGTRESGLDTPHPAVAAQHNRGWIYAEVY